MKSSPSISERRNFVVKINERDAPRGIGRPKSVSDWEGSSFSTKAPRKTIQRQRLPLDQAASPRSGDELYIWVNEYGFAAIAAAEGDPVPEENSKIRIRLARVRLIPLGMDREWLKAKQQLGNVFDDIVSSTVWPLRCISDEAAKHLDLAITDDRDYGSESRNEIERQLRLGMIARRPDHRKFSEAIRKNYRGRCAITGCGTGEALEAAHIRVSDGKDCNDPSNGLLLRADIHALFDGLLITLTPEGTGIEVSRQLTDPSYDFLRKAQVSLPTCGPKPSLQNIRDHRRRFEQQRNQIHS